MIILIAIIFLVCFISRHNKTNKIVKELMSAFLAQYLIELHHNHYIINYPYGAKWYKIIVKRERAPKIILDITNCNDSILNEVEPYLGPCRNFHGMQITPFDLGYGTINVETLIDTITFESNETIKI